MVYTPIGQPKAPLPCVRKWNTVAELLCAGLSEKQARLVLSSVPKRGTPAWRERELLRSRLGNCCISLP